MAALSTGPDAAPAAAIPAPPLALLQPVLAAPPGAAAAAADLAAAAMEGVADVLADGLSRHASPRTIAAFSAACRASRAAVRAQGDALWEALARRRWRAPRRAHADSWRGLYCSANGWSRAAWSRATLPNASDAEESEAAAWLGGGEPAEAGHFAVVSGGRLEVWSASVPGAGAAGAPATALRARSGPHAGGIVSLCSLGGGPAGAELILGGGRDGLLTVYEWRSGADGGDGSSAGGDQGAGGPAQSAEAAGGALRLASSLRGAGGGPPQPLCQIAPLGPAVVAGLYEDVFGLAPASPSSTIRTWDLNAGREASRPVSSELGEGSHRAVAMCAPDRGGSPCLVVAAFDGEACTRCRDDGNPTLCYHKHRARSATLLEVDPRAPGGVVARYTAMHRSIQRHLATARGQFLFTSHAGMPLAAWDLRHMGAGPVFQEPRLLSPWEWGDELGLAEAFDGPGGAPMARHQRHNPGGPPPSQATWLQASHDTLLGRAEDSVWAWDLSATLGWAREPGAPMGAWAQLASEPWRVPLLRAGARAVPVTELGFDDAGGVAMLFPDHPACAFAYNEWEAGSYRTVWRLVRALPAQQR